MEYLFFYLWLAKTFYNVELKQVFKINLWLSPLVVAKTRDL